MDGRSRLAAQRQKHGDHRHDSLQADAIGNGDIEGEAQQRRRHTDRRGLGIGQVWVLHLGVTCVRVSRAKSHGAVVTRNMKARHLGETQMRVQEWPKSQQPKKDSQEQVC